MLITVKGKIKFDPDKVTKKHLSKSSHKTCLIELYGADLSAYYSWFLSKKGLNLIGPLRGSHITLIDDKFMYLKGSNILMKTDIWNKVKEKYDRQKIEIEINISKYHSSTKHWWFRLSKKSDELLMKIRNELGLNKPKFPFHVTIGYINDRPENIIQSFYLQEIIKLHYE